MGFPDHERDAMLALKGVGPTVVQRLEEIGFERLADLRGVAPEAVNRQIAQMMRSTCWANSPLARAAIQALVELAQRTP
jgi:hypothetical protein